MKRTWEEEDEVDGLEIYIGRWEEMGVGIG